ncbi:MAG: endonuclease III domain-containing protein [Acidobacteriota bacterium]|nr:endonuclease III domain-containing protein [Acidobacteriota bacterium]
MHLERQQGEAVPGETLRRFYATLLESFGPQGWWPARTRWEVIWGAILTQNTTWRNASLAIKNLRKAGALGWRRLRQVPIAELEQMIRPAGFFRQKAQALHNFTLWIEQVHGGSLRSLFGQEMAKARAQLLALKGIGPETADAILLYSGRHPVFVADAYTRRILSRHNLLSPTADYHSAQQFLHQHLPPDEAVYNEYHALLVEAAKRYCHRNVAHCEKCPLGKFLEKPTADSRQLTVTTSCQPSAVS